MCDDSFYVAERIQSAIAFIRSNTDWEQIGGTTFKRGDEKIIVISDFYKIQGRKVNNIYIDHSFTKIKNSMYMDFVGRFKYLGVKPITIKECSFLLSRRG